MYNLLDWGTVYIDNHSMLMIGFTRLVEVQVRSGYSMFSVFLFVCLFGANYVYRVYLDALKTFFY